MDSLPLVAVVVNLDGGEMLDACLDALDAQRPAGIVVVDNGSNEAELSRLAARKGLSLVRLGENRGFAGPANVGVGEGFPRGDAAPYVALVNNDCVLEAEYLRLCLDALERDPALAAAQGVVLDGAGQRVDGCGIGWNGRAEAVQILRGELPPPRDAAPFAIAGVSATAAVFRRADFLAAGGFEESFFAYYEDVDLSLRLARSDRRFACVPAARARHLGSATGRRRPAARWTRLLANRMRTLRRNVHPEALRAFPRRVLTASALRSAARDVGWLRAGLLAGEAVRLAAASRHRDLEVLSERPPLMKLPS